MAAESVQRGLVVNWYKRAQGSGFYQALMNLRPQMAAAAQAVYDRWDQSDPDGDPELGFGGICQDIAEAIADVVSSSGFNAGTMSAQCGEQHVWCVAYAEIPTPYGVEYEGYHVDIPYSVYERGGGYNWQKIEGVQFDPSHITISSMQSDDVAGYLEYGE